MKIGTRLFILFLTFNLLSCTGNAQETEIQKSTNEFEYSEIGKSAFPNPIGFVNDYGGVFTESERSELSKRLYDYEIKTTRQIAIVTVDSIKPYEDIIEYATDLGKAWGVGTAEKNNGLIIVVCNYCREIGIATGAGTELILSDEICKEVIDNIIIPEFKKEEFYKGITNGVNELILKWE